MTIDHPSTAAITFGLSHALASVTLLAALHPGANAPRAVREAEALRVPLAGNDGLAVQPLHLAPEALVLRGSSEPPRGELFRAVDGFLDDGESGRELR